MTPHAIYESSGAVRAWRVTVEGSRVGWALRSLRTLLRPLLTVLALDVHGLSPDAGFRAIPPVADDSVAFRAIAPVVMTRAVDWRASWTGARVAPLVDAWALLDRASRIRLVALTLLVAVSTHLAMTGFSAPVPTPLAREIWTFIVASLAVIVAAAPALAAAWLDWRRRWRRGAMETNGVE